MEILLKVSAVTLVAASLTLFLRKYNPEISILLSMCSIIIVFAFSSSVVGRFTEIIDNVKTLISPSDMLISPVLKCLGISLVTKITAELCRDSSQAATAAAIEFAGAACAMAVSMPMIIGTLKMISSFV